MEVVDEILQLLQSYLLKEEQVLRLGGLLPPRPLGLRSQIRHCCNHAKEMEVGIP